MVLLEVGGAMIAWTPGNTGVSALSSTVALKKAGKWAPLDGRERITLRRRIAVTHHFDTSRRRRNW